MSAVPLLSRMKAAYSILFTTLVSIVLIGLRGWESIGIFRQYVEQHRAIASAIGQVLSSALGMLQLYTATTLINAGTRIYINERSVSLDSLKFWTSLIAGRVDGELPLRQMIVTFLFFLVAQAPAALWAGSITPVFITTTVVAGSIQVPIFSQATEHVWNNQFQLRGPQVWNIETNCTTSRSQQGFAASCPVPDMQELLLYSASSATTTDGTPRNHSKNDNQEWIYQGRSFGVGSSQGVVPLIDVPKNSELQNYQYSEIGYTSHISCQRNASTTYGAQAFQTAYDNDLTIWEIGGYLPNSVPGNPENYPVVTFFEASLVEFLAWSAVVNGNTNMIAITTSEKYVEFNQTQCVVTFTPTQFDVVANISSKIVTVLPSNSTSTVVSAIEPTGRLTANIMYSLNLLSRMSTTLYRSVLGESLNYNLETIAGDGTDTNLNQSSINAVVEAAFEAVVDDVLVAFGVAELILANSSTSTPITGTYTAVRIGQDTFIYASLGVNIILIILVVIEALRTGLWRKLPVFDYTNVASVAIAASAGHSSIADEVRRRRENMRAMGFSKIKPSVLLREVMVRLQSLDGQGREEGHTAIVATPEYTQPVRHYSYAASHDTMELNLLHHRSRETVRGWQGVEGDEWTTQRLTIY